MRRRSIGLIIFFLTVVVGLVAVWLLVFPSRPTKPLESDVPPVSTTPLPVDVTDELPLPPDIDSDTKRVRDIESFIDQRKIGRPGRNKIEVRCFDSWVGAIAEIKFYSHDQNGPWEQKQSFEFPKDDFLACDPKIEDFNNDGSGDFTYQSVAAARGANEV